MELEKDLITIENSKKLLNNILLSIKSSKDVRCEIGFVEAKNRDREHSIVKTNSISTNHEDRKRISSFSIYIKRFDKRRWFGKTEYEYELNLLGGDRGYDKFEVSIDTHQNIIQKIYDFLIDLERNKKIEETNQTLESIISDISTTIEKKYKRDETIDEILN